MQTATYTIPVQNVEEAKKNLDVQIQSAQGKVLLQWSAVGPVDGNPNLIPFAGKPIAEPIPINAHTPIEQLYLQGVFLEKTGNQLGALKFFDRVLAQDSGYVPALLKEAWYSYNAADFQEAESLIALAAARDTEDPTIAYTTGVIDRADGRLSLRTMPSGMQFTMVPLLLPGQPWRHHMLNWEKLPSVRATPRKQSIC